MQSRQARASVQLLELQLPLSLEVEAADRSLEAEVPGQQAVMREVAGPGRPQTVASVDVGERRVGAPQRVTARGREPVLDRSGAVDAWWTRGPERKSLCDALTELFRDQWKNNIRGPSYIWKPSTKATNSNPSLPF